MTNIDIVIPVYNEKENIISTLDSLYYNVKNEYVVFICYDFDEDNTLEAIKNYPRERAEFVLVKNPGEGPNQAIIAGLKATTAPVVLTYMADDDFNSEIVDQLVEKLLQGYDIVTGSRFMPGGVMKDGTWYKEVLTRLGSFAIRHFAGIPVHDVTNGIRVHSRRLVDTIEFESTLGFTNTIESMVKAVRLGWKVGEIPCKWFERQKGESRFRILSWLFPYIRWLLYGLATKWLRRGPETVRLRPGATP